MAKTATVTDGPGVWLGKSGTVLYVDLDWAIVAIEGKDDCGTTVYNVRFPLSCVKIVNELVVA